MKVFTGQSNRSVMVVCTNPHSYQLLTKRNAEFWDLPIIKSTILDQAPNLELCQVDFLTWIQSNSRVQQLTPQQMSLADLKTSRGFFSPADQVIIDLLLPILAPPPKTSGQSQKQNYVTVG